MKLKFTLMMSCTLPNPSEIFSIHPSSGHFRYFMVLINASTHWSHVCLFFSARNVVFARLLAQIIQLKAQFPDHLIKTICLDNASEFSFKTIFLLLYVGWY